MALQHAWCTVLLLQRSGSAVLLLKLGLLCPAL
jgi:hypothetical protein